MIWIGTSGFQYPEWKGTFYPRDLAVKKMLAYYAARFSTTEINYSFRRIPSVTTLSNWSAETPVNFRFSLKALQEITHVKELRDCDEVLTRFWEAAVTLKEKLGVILFQLPPYFRKDISVLNDFLALFPREMKSAFEFRHESWFNEEVFDSLRSRNVALCIADSEKLRTPVVTTADYGYFRLRDQGYTRTDIARWAATIAAQQKQLKDIYVYFKHEESGLGPKFADQLKKVLGSEPVNANPL
jgi:uncharacterized protein YecE (DUF72 family)